MTEPGASEPHVEIMPVERTPQKTVASAPPKRRARQDALASPMAFPIQRPAWNAIRRCRAIRLDRALTWQEAGGAHMSADGFGGGFVVASDDDDADAGLAAGRDGCGRLGPRRIMHAHQAQQCQPCLVSLSHLRSARAHQCIRQGSPGLAVSAMPRQPQSTCPAQESIECIRQYQTTDRESPSSSISRHMDV